MRNDRRNSPPTQTAPECFWLSPGGNPAYGPGNLCFAPKGQFVHVCGALGWSIYIDREMTIADARAFWNEKVADGYARTQAHGESLASHQRNVFDFYR